MVRMTWSNLINHILIAPMPFHNLLYLIRRDILVAPTNGMYTMNVQYFVSVIGAQVNQNLILTQNMQLSVLRCQRSTQVHYLKAGKKNMIRVLEGIFIGVQEQIEYLGYLLDILRQRYVIFINKSSWPCRITQNSSYTY